MSQSMDLGLDLAQFAGIFFEEAAENLDQMEQLLLSLDIQAADEEQLNAIFRCAHSVKGGAATFGFADVAELTHRMESLLDRLRRREIQGNSKMVDALLESADVSRSMLLRHQNGAADAPISYEALALRIAQLAGGSADAAALEVAKPIVVEAPVTAQKVESKVAQDKARILTITIGPLSDPKEASPVFDLFRDIEGLGTIAETGDPGAAVRTFSAVTASSTQDLLNLFELYVAPGKVKFHDPNEPQEPVFEVLPVGHRRLKLTLGPVEMPQQLDAIKDLFREIAGLGSIQDGLSDNHSVRVFFAETSASDDELLDLFAFHVGRELVVIEDISESGLGLEVAADDPPPGAPLAPAPGYGFFEENPGVPAALKQALAFSSGASSATVEKPGVAKAAAAPAAEQTIRVSVSKVDQLINLVGELVINQAMLAQNSQSLDPALHQQLLSGLADLDRNTRDLQESVMSIRMIPMSVVFSRFPRMLRDLAAKLDKKVDFVTQGEATELDKGLVEKITDPLTHLVRNSCDHGIELPKDRLAKGKPETGAITLSAAHKGGSIVIEVRDDGRGLNREKILAKARERGIAVHDNMPDSEVWQLIFAPGFSTADTVTDISGRGVGMDVVKRNIQDLGGSVEIESHEGYGMRVAVRLPLTLAIMDGMSVGVGEEVYILPLSSVVESFQAKEAEINTVGTDAEVVKVRDEFMPVLAVEEIFGVRRSSARTTDEILVIVEADGHRVALRVDQLLGQQQVVVKNLETNYRKVPNISGATILGDGMVALILDTSALVRKGRA